MVMLLDKNLLVYIAKESIYLEFDGNNYVNSYSDINFELEDIFNELNLSNDINIYLIADICFFNIENNKVRIKKEILDEVCKFRKRSKFNKIYLSHYLELFLSEYNNTNIFIVYDDISYMIKYSHRLEKIETTNFVKSDLEQGQDFPDHVLIISEEEVWNKLRTYDVKYVHSNYLKYRLNIKGIYIFIFILAIINVIFYLFINSKYDMNLLNTDIIKNTQISSDIKDKIESLNNMVEEKESYNNDLKNIFKKPIYLDIELFLKSIVYGVEYTDIAYNKDRWTVKGNIENIDMLYSFENKLKEEYDVVLIKEIKDNNDKIEFTYEIGNNKKV